MSDWVGDFLRYAQSAVASATSATSTGYLDPMGTQRRKETVAAGTTPSADQDGPGVEATEELLEKTTEIPQRLSKTNEETQEPEESPLGSIAGGPRQINEERAAILEFMAGFSRSQAEELARDEAWTANEVATSGNSSVNCAIQTNDAVNDENEGG